MVMMSNLIQIQQALRRVNADPLPGHIHFDADRLVERDENLPAFSLDHQDLARADRQHIFDPSGHLPLAVHDRAADKLEKKELILFPRLQDFLRDKNVESGQTIGLRERIHALQLEVKVLAMGDQRFDGVLPEIPPSSYKNAPQIRTIIGRYMEEPESELSFLTLAS
jgi:hypothetical protein